MLAVLAVLGILRQENEAGAIIAERRQMQTDRWRLMREKPVRHLDQNTGAVAGIGLAAAGAAMFQIDQDLQGVLNDLMALAVLEIGDEADAARVMLVARIIKSLRFWLDVWHVQPRSRMSTWRGSSALGWHALRYSEGRASEG